MASLASLRRFALTKRQWRSGVLLYVAYVAAMRLTHSFFSAPGLIFPAAGIAVGGLFLEGYVLWPFVVLAAATGYLLNGSSLLIIILMPLVHLAQALFAAWALKKLKLDPLFRKPSDIFGFLGISVIAAAIVPTFGNAIRYLNNTFYDVPISAVTWTSWYVAILMSLVIVTPFVIRWFAKPHFTRTPTEWIEIFVTLGFLSAFSYLLFWTENTAVYGISLVYFLLVPLFWISIRLTPRFMTLGLLILSSIAIAGLFFGPFGFEGEELGNRLFQTEIFLTIVATIFLIQVVLEEQRRIALKLVGSQVQVLTKARDELVTETQAKSDFIAVIAHELRNPIAPIESSIDLLRSVNHDKKNADTLDMMRDRMDVVKRLLDDMLDMSRVAKNKLSIKKERVELCDLVRRAAGANMVRLAGRNQKLKIDLPDEMVEVDADPVRIEQVISNLITNASKFSDEGDTITISLRSNGAAEITVTDEGIGIDPLLQGRIFDPFQQVEAGERTRKGIGIGLALVRSLIEMHDGSVSVRSEGRGKGSTFLVRLPLVAHPSLSQEKKKVAASVLKKMSASVLIVDDNDAAAWGVGKLLEMSGCTVDFAYDGAQALERATEMKPDVVLLDIGLPDMDGYKVAKALRATNYTGTLVALTGYGLEDNHQAVRDAGFDDYLTKPVGLADLKRVIPFAK